MASDFLKWPSRCLAPQVLESPILIPLRTDGTTSAYLLHPPAMPRSVTVYTQPFVNEKSPQHVNVTLIYQSPHHNQYKLLNQPMQSTVVNNHFTNVTSYI